MKESEVKYKVSETLHAFETIEPMEVSAAWELSLLDKIAKGKAHSPSMLRQNKFVVMLFFVVLINIGVIVGSMISGDKQPSQRNSDLKVISSEFLINPTSINR